MAVTVEIGRDEMHDCWYVVARCPCPPGNMHAYQVQVPSQVSVAYQSVGEALSTGVNEATRLCEEACAAAAPQVVQLQNWTMTMDVYDGLKVSLDASLHGGLLQPIDPHKLEVALGKALVECGVLSTTQFTPQKKPELQLAGFMSGSLTPKSGHVGGETVMQKILAVFPQVAVVRKPCPAGPCSWSPPGSLKTLSEMIPHLNDYHKWTFEQAADWLDALPEDLRADDPSGVAAEPSTCPHCGNAHPGAGDTSTCWNWQSKGVQAETTLAKELGLLEYTPLSGPVPNDVKKAETQLAAYMAADAKIAMKQWADAEAQLEQFVKVKLEPWAKQVSGALNKVADSEAFKKLYTNSFGDAAVASSALSEADLEKAFKKLMSGPTVYKMSEAVTVDEWVATHLEAKTQAVFEKNLKKLQKNLAKGVN